MTANETDRPTLATLMRARRFPEALDLLKAALRRDPTDTALALTRAQVLLAMGARLEAIAAADALLLQAGGNAALLDQLGAVYSFAADQSRALQAYDAAVVLEPQNAAHRYNRASVRRFLGDLTGAETDFDAVIALRPDDAEAYRQRAGLRVQSADRNHVAELEQVLTTTPQDWRTETSLRYALAKEYEDLGEYPSAFAQLSQGATLRRRHTRYDVAADVATVDDIMAAFPSPLPATPSLGGGPIFIIGLPRTGTTLVDRILSSHPEVTSAGELSDFARALVEIVPPGGAPLPRPELIRRSAQVNFEELGRRYLARAWASLGWESPSPQRRFTDKLPLNYLYCGLIRRALLGARLVHVTRHPMASCYAMYKTLFKEAYPFSYDLADLGAYYLGYRRLMAHWHAVLPGQVLDISYEGLVRGLEGETRRLLAFCGLPWNEACLAFHLNTAATTTASAAQVRQPLYDTSLEQWRHYRTELKGLEAQLTAAGIAI